VLFVSLHGEPADPTRTSRLRRRAWRRRGRGLQLNLPLPKGTRWAAYQQALEQACARLRRHAPEVLVVSLGVDTFKDDPISHFQLDSPDYLAMGRMIAAVGVPTLFVMEGGYMVDEIGINAVNVLTGLEEAAAEAGLAQSPRRTAAIGPAGHTQNCLENTNNNPRGFPMQPESPAAPGGRHLQRT
jgi:acetoin utilization deacetylase AcuC-like enzyme